MNKLKEQILKITMTLIVVSIVMQPVEAWGPISHMSIISDISDINYEVISDNIRFANGGSIGQDTSFYALWGYPANCNYHSDISPELYELANTDQKRAYALGWSTHGPGDEQEDILVGTFPILSEQQVEIGVDGNVVDNTNYRISVPYGLVREAYSITCDRPPSISAIFYATRTQVVAIYLESYLINLGVFNNLINLLADSYEPYYDQSIADSIIAIDALQDPASSGLLSITSVDKSVKDKTKKNKKHEIDNDIRQASYELLEEGTIEIPIIEDRKNEVFDFGNPVIKDEEKFNKKMNELVEKTKVKNKQAK